MATSVSKRSNLSESRRSARWRECFGIHLPGTLKERTLSVLRSRWMARWMLLVFLGQLLPVGIGKRAAADRTAWKDAFHQVLSQQIQLLPGKRSSVSLPGLSHAHLYSVTVSLDPAAIHDIQIELTVRDTGQAIGGKTLHLGDPDLYLLIRPTRDGAGRIEVQSAVTGKNPRPVSIHINVIGWNT